MSKTLLQKIIDRRTKPEPIKEWSRQSIEEAEVLVAWIEGKIDSAEAISVLGIRTTSQVHQKAGTTLRNLHHDGYISITWNTPRDIVIVGDAGLANATFGE